MCILLFVHAHVHVHVHVHVHILVVRESLQRSKKVYTVQRKSTTFKESLQRSKMIKDDESLQRLKKV